MSQLRVLKTKKIIAFMILVSFLLIVVLVQQVISDDGSQIRCYDCFHRTNYLINTNQLTLDCPYRIGAGDVYFTGDVESFEEVISYAMSQEYPECHPAWQGLFVVLNE